MTSSNTQTTNVINNKSTSQPELLSETNLNLITTVTAFEAPAVTYAAVQYSEMMS